MSWIGWLFLLLTLVYIGNVLGCMILCETIPDLISAKRYVWMVPVLNVMLFIYFFYSLLRKLEFGTLWRFIRFPQKNIFALKAIISSIREEAAEEVQYNRFHTKKRTAERRVAVLTGIFRNCDTVISLE